MNSFKYLICVGLIFIYSDVSATDRENLFKSNWEQGIDERVQFQRPNIESIDLVALDGFVGKFIKVKIDRNSDYSKVANGSPRAEISFGGIFRFDQNKTYVVSWQTYIPSNYEFDCEQSELIAQIHQGPAAGYPPFAIFISENNTYEIHNRTQSQVDSVTAFFGKPTADVGKIVRWQLLYRPDSSGEKSITELKKDGVLVFSIKGVRNSYVKDNNSYLKLGLYKADWLKIKSNVQSRTLYYGAVSVEKIEDSD
jgi:hypothetical protein